jgi:hypothetical protein
MTRSIELPSDATVEQLNMIIGALYLSLGYTISHIDRTEPAESFGAFRHDLIEALKSGAIDMAIFDDAKTFDLVVAMVEGLLARERQPQGEAQTSH